MIRELLPTGGITASQNHVHTSGSRAADRYLTAGNETTPPAVLAQLAQDDEPAVRRHVAENPNTPAETLWQLAQDEDCEVRLSVAEHPKAPVPVLEILALDDCEDVRFGLAENPNLPQHVLRILSKDHNVFVSCRAMQTLSVLAAMVLSVGL